MPSKTHSSEKARKKANREPLHPKNLYFVLFGLDTRVTVEWLSGQLFLFRLGKNAKERTPTAEEWETFWKKVGAIGVWKWKRRYKLKGIDVADGQHWHLRMSRGARRVESSGDNEYPGTTGPQPSKSFLRLMRAFEELSKSSLTP
jgi:hypothetical protein